MIMPRGSGQLLLPLNPVYFWFTLLAALVANLVPFGRVPALPDVLAVALAFWSMHQPLRIGVGAGFFFGLVMDVHDGALLGQHALAYVLLCFASGAVHRRLLWFDLPSQVLQVLPLFAGMHLVSLAVRLLAGDMLPGWSLLLAPVFEALLWPVAHWLLLAPQRRPPDRDENRPL
jgi:rod shape-determining protein MreD